MNENQVSATVAARVTQVDTSELEPQLVRLLELIVAGEEVVIARGGQPVARIVPVVQTAKTRREPGGLEHLKLPDNLFDPLPEDELAAWE